jgi:hypothetical protein
MCHCLDLPLTDSLFSPLNVVLFCIIQSLVRFCCTPDIFVCNGNEEEDEEAPYQIHRKLLRRRHVRKEQLQKRRELAARTRLEESSPLQMEGRKRGRIDETLPLHPLANPSQSSSPMELSVPQSLKDCQSCNNACPFEWLQTDTSKSTEIRIVIGGPILSCHSLPLPPTATSLSFHNPTLKPSFSPVRPAKRRNIHSA